MTSRSGAALIIAIVVLAALLLLGLPFLFTQSGSLAGTRSYAHGQLAHIGQDSAQNMGIAAAADAAGYHWRKDGVERDGKLYLDDWSDLSTRLWAEPRTQGMRGSYGVNRIEFDTRSHRYALPGASFLAEVARDHERDLLLQRYPTVVGLAIEDESGKLDPNHLDAIAWRALLRSPQVGIHDGATTAGPVTADDAPEPLAQALAGVRYGLPGGRITALDQLLLAQPQPSADVPQPRRGLTRAELARLRRYLSVAVPAQARGGMIDLGTVIGMENRRMSFDSAAPAALLAFPVTPQVIGIGTTLLVPDGETGVRSFPVTGHEEVSTPVLYDAVAISAPPLVNLHQAEAPVRATFSATGVPQARPPIAADPDANPPVPFVPPQPSSITGLGSYSGGQPPRDGFGQLRSWFDLVAPLGMMAELGSVAVTGAHLPEPTTDLDTDEVVEATSSQLVLSGDRLDRFPGTGYARLDGPPPVTTIPAPPIPSDHFEYVFYDAHGQLPLSTSQARSGASVAVTVERGYGPGGTPGNRIGRSFKRAQLTFTVIAAHELHPLGIASQGTITIASAATVTDAAGNQTAQDQHRVVAQALPQDAKLEVRYDKQAALHALLAQRHGSLMTTFPVPYPRLSGTLPDDPANTVPPAHVVRSEPNVDPAYPDQSVGMRPAVLRTLIGSAHLATDWTLALGGTAQDALQATSIEPLTRRVTSTIPILSLANNRPLQAATTPYGVSDITPEGLKLDENRVLAFPNRSRDGLLPDTFRPGTVTNPGALAPISGRQFSLWVRPDEDWRGTVVLLEMRVPASNVGLAFKGTTDASASYDPRVAVGDEHVSGRFRLSYSHAGRLLILELNPGVIPFTLPEGFGPAIPRELYGPLYSSALPIESFLYPAINPECLGMGGANPMSCGSQFPDSVQHRYKLGDTWSAGDWHLVQVAFSSNLPGGMSIIVDGLVGRDVARLGSRDEAMMRPGDHVTLPTLVLDQDLPGTPTVAQAGAKALYIPRLQLDCYFGRQGVKGVLPKRGIVRIGNEYISYEAIDDTGGLLNCVRARRQRTDAQLTMDESRSHVMEDHRQGDLVLPGGFAIGNVQVNHWFRGGCQLAQELPDGDPNRRFLTWSRVHSLTAAGVDTVLLSGGRLEDFPRRGFFDIAHADPGLPGQLYFYDNTAGPTPGDPSTVGLLNVHAWRTVMVPDPDDTNTPPRLIPKTGWVPGLTELTAGGTEVVIVSIELTGDPTVPGAYEGAHGGAITTNGAPPPDPLPVDAARQDEQAYLVQLYDPRPASTDTSGGRAEWLTYTSIDSRTDYPTSRPPNGPPLQGQPNQRMSFLLNRMLFTSQGATSYRPGFWFDPASATAARTGARGRQRTAFAASDFRSYDKTMRFPPNTRVIPVQRHIQIAYLLEAGDIITLSPTTMRAGETPVQMCVRYSAADGFPETLGASWPWNVMNRYFAFTEAMPTGWNPGNSAFHLLCWPCWTPARDISPLNTGPSWEPQRLGWVLPWGNAFTAGYQPTDANVLERPLVLFTNNVGRGVPVTIDALSAGAQPGWVPPVPLQSTGLVQAQVTHSGTNALMVDTPWLTADRTVFAGTQITVSEAVFNNTHGLVEVGGEVLAYRRLLNALNIPLTNRAEIIGRALLGSMPRAHRGPEPVLHLPLGPVAEITDWKQVDALTGVTPRLSLSGSIAAPAILLTSRDGEHQELAALPHAHTAPWLRGLYNTTLHDGFDPAPPPPPAPPPSPPPYFKTALAIGWWPRYPSLFPHDLANPPTPPTPALTRLERGQYLRCRSYAWAGFPLRFHHSRFAGADVAEVTMIDDGAGRFDTWVLALDGSMDWGAAVFGTLNPDVANGLAASAEAAFLHDRFQVAAREDINRRLENRTGTIRVVDGAELRVVWTYNEPRLPVSRTTPPTLPELDGPLPAEWLLRAARNGNRAPMLGPVTLRANAPNQVISVER